MCVQVLVPQCYHMWRMAEWSKIFEITHELKYLEDTKFLIKKVVLIFETRPLLSQKTEQMCPQSSFSPKILLFSKKLLNKKYSAPKKKVILIFGVRWPNIGLRSEIWLFWRTSCATDLLLWISTWNRFIILRMQCSIDSNAKSGKLLLRRE